MELVPVSAPEATAMPEATSVPVVSTVPVAGPMPVASPLPMPTPVPVGPKPCPVTCPSCKTVIMTKVRNTATMKTHLMSLCLCAHFCGLLCMWLPYCMKSCRNADHYCPSCGTYLGTYKR